MRKPQSSREGHEQTHLLVIGTSGRESLKERRLQADAEYRTGKQPVKTYQEDGELENDTEHRWRQLTLRRVYWR